MTIDYSTTYNEELMQKSDGIKNLNNGQIKFGDALAAVAYAHDISYEQLIETFPEVKNNERFDRKYTSKQQMQFIRKHATRTPKKILEIGAGRGEVTVFLSAMGYDVTAVEPGEHFEQLITQSKNKLRLGDVTTPYKLINTPIHLANIDYSEYDTILMVESLEHILAEHFDPEWQKIKANFKGYFIVVNWKKYHPIKVGQYARKEIHCRLVDDALYDNYCKGHTTKVRDRSHLCVEL
jgi:SAM-dependent methyltransferase